ncbi:DUF3487 family protein [Vibrio jasicida]|uniref:DUF3487 family protein n=1 Tax=Vibrio jasicida TaxID=766224 RepID=UPI0005EDC4E1|nr:DUF3487 family protein [Vibrio jasicida]
MKSSACLNVMPAFYKGLSLGEIGVLTLFNTLVLGSIGLVLALATGWWLCFFSALMLGLMSMALLPKSVIAPLERIKTRHCQFYLQKQWSRRWHSARYVTQSCRFAPRRTVEKS